MKIRAKANGMLLDLPDSQAEAYMSTGLYDLVEEAPQQEATKVEPLTTTDLPPKKKKAK